MKFENTEVYGFKRALKGMRNPLESWHKNDTVEENGKVVIGENDLDLAQRLIKSAVNTENLCVRFLCRLI